MTEQRTSKMEAAFRAEHRRRPIAIRMGWDRALQQHYLAIDFADGKREPVYRSEDDPNVSRYTDLTHFLRYLLSLGVRIPKEAVRAVSAAPLWRLTPATSEDSSRMRETRYAKSY